MLNNQALYAYDASMKWFFEAYKFMGGYHLRNLFVAEIQAWVQAPILVPIPVTDTTLQTRGFNQTLGLLGELPVHEYLRCKVVDKPMQSKKTRQARLQSPQPFELAVDQTLVEQKDIVLFDDVYTTGRTLYHAAECLYAAGANKVSSMTLSR
ncbi:MAG: hypothetical protein LBT80_07325 [Lactobacillaceae bacterium]|nr:hypothetical protein [Lactobacillaceae bacterium]